MPFGGTLTPYRFPPAGETTLALPLLAWEGGSAYWAQFPKASAAGWTSTSFFPISEFLVNPATIGQAAELASLGINVAMAADFSPPVSNITDHMFLIANPDNPFTTPAETGWDSSDIGSDGNVVGWFLCDEPDSGLGGFIGTDDEDGWLAALQSLASTARALNDGRFVFTNFSNGILNTFWSVNKFDEMVASVDACCCDQYAYTRPQIRTNFGDSTQ